MSLVDNVVSFPSRMADSFRNLIANLGTPRDKAFYQEAVVDILTVNDLEALYRSDWISRKIVDLPSFDSTRAWRLWQADKKQVEALEEQERLLGIQRKLQLALQRARLYGGAAMVLGIDGTGPFNEELDLDKVKRGSLKFVHVVHSHSIQAGPRVRDITSPWYGEPSFYQRSNIPTVDPPGGVTPMAGSSLGYNPGDVLFIHPSRVVRLIGLEYPNIDTAQDAWGDSALQPVYDAIKGSGLVNGSISAMISEAKTDVIKVPGLSEVLSTTEGTRKYADRFGNAMLLKSTVNVTLLDKNEEFERRELSFSNMDKVMQMYLLIAAGAADIPATRLLGREPAGMNSTGDSDVRNYYDRLQSEQKVHLTPAVSRLDEVLIRHTLGERDPAINYNWNSLWQVPDSEKAEIAFKKAQAHKIDVDSGLIDPDVLRKGRENQLIEDDFYPGLQLALDEKREQEENELDEVYDYGTSAGREN